MREGVAVQEVDRPLQDADQAAQDAVHDVPDHVAFGAFLVRGHGRGLPQHVDDRDQQAAQADAPEGVGHGAAEGAPGCAGWHAARFAGAEVP